MTCKLFIFLKTMLCIWYSIRQSYRYLYLYFAVEVESFAVLVAAVVCPAVFCGFLC